MALEPAEQRWIEDSLGQLFVAGREMSKSLALAEQRLEQADGRNKLLWGLVAALVLGLLGGAGAYIYWSGTVDTTLRAQSRQIDDLQSSVRTLTKDLLEHERRSGTPK